MGVNMQVAEVLNELACMNTCLINLKEKVKILGERFQQYLNNQNLTGEAFDSHKDYIGAMQLPVAEGIMDYCTRMVDANAQYSQCIQQYFSSRMHIDEDGWRAEYDTLISQYNALNTHMNHIMEVLRLFLGPFRPPYIASSSYAWEQSLRYQCNSLSQELDLLRNAIEYYRDNIENIGYLLSDSAAIYEEAARLQAVLIPAIQQLKAVSVSPEGEYRTIVMNRQPFQDVKDCVLLLKLSDQIKLELGEESLSAEEFRLLPPGDQAAYVNRVAALFAACYPTIAGEIASERVEIPIGPGLSIYAETTVEGSLDPENPAAIHLALEENQAVLSSWSVTVGDLELEWGVDGISLSKEVPIDEDTIAYMQVSAEGGIYSEEISAEWGVTTEIEEGRASVTSACGLTASGPEEQWEPVPVEDYVLEEAGEPIFDLEILEEWGPLLWSPVPAPIPVPIG